MRIHNGSHCTALFLNWLATKLVADGDWQIVNFARLSRSVLVEPAIKKKDDFHHGGMVDRGDVLPVSGTRRKTQLVGRGDW